MSFMQKAANRWVGYVPNSDRIGVKMTVLGTGANEDSASMRPIRSALSNLIRGQNAVKNDRQLAATVASLYRCIVYRSNAISSMPRQIEDVNTGEIIAQANFPTPEVDNKNRPIGEENIPFDIELSEILFQTEWALCLDSAAYWHKERNLVVLTAVKWLDPTITKPKRNASGVIGFEKKVKGRPYNIDLADCVYIWMPGEKEAKRPRPSPVDVVLDDVGVIYHQREFVKKFFEGGAMPTTLFFAEDEPEDHEKNRIRDFLMRRLLGRGQAWNLEVLSKRLSFETLTPPIKDMMLPQIKNQAQIDVCAGMGVPVSLLFSNTVTRSSMGDQDDIHFYTKTAIPQVLRIEELVNNQLFLSLGLRLRFRPDMLPAFRAQKWERLKALSPFLSYLDEDEVRRLAGFAPRSQQATKSIKHDPSHSHAHLHELPDVLSDQLAFSGLKQGALLDLKRWQKKVLRFHHEGEYPYIVPFSSSSIPIHVEGQIKRQLLYARNEEEIKLAFASPFRHPS